MAPQALCSILCSSSCRNMNDPATYTPFRLFSANVRQPIEWPEKTDVCCWWCCHKFDTVPTCIPALYSLEKRFFEVFGIFCSWNCAKAYVQSGYSSDSSEQLMWMRILAQEVFGCNIDELNAAPPRIFLTMFGGHLSIDEFRKKSHVATTALLHPPLVSYPMVLQELQTAPGLPAGAACTACAAARAKEPGAAVKIWPARAPPSRGAFLSGRIMGEVPHAGCAPGSPRPAPNPQNSMYVEFMQRKQEDGRRRRAGARTPKRRRLPPGAKAKKGRRRRPAKTRASGPGGPGGQRRPPGGGEGVAAVPVAARAAAAAGAAGTVARRPKIFCA